MQFSTLPVYQAPVEIGKDPIVSIAHWDAGAESLKFRATFVVVMNPFGCALFAWYQLYLYYRAHLSDIFSSQADKIKKNITQLALTADHLDNFFMDKFGCEMAVEAKEV